MEFCSKYGYDYGFDGSDEEEMNDFNYETNTSTRKQVRKADSNIIAAKFDELVKSNETFAGSFFDCSKCKAIVSSHSLSNITKTNDEKFIWTCEYCSNLNDLSEKFMQSLDEIPDKDDVTFLIEPARDEISNKTNEIKSLNDNHLTYCIDISGSMDTQIQNDDKHTKIQKHRSGISRLNGVQMACLENLTCLKDTEPNRKVSLLTFSEKVKYFGDGTNCNINEPLINTSRTNYKNNEMIIEIPNDILTNKEKMFSLAQNQSKNENLVGLSESYDNLKEIIKNLSTEGTTALGPALAFSIGYLSDKRDGSQIILCTDGVANVGMGNLEKKSATNDAELFYENLADYAKMKSISVNIITMEGTDCKLSLLGKVADKTNGFMNIVNPNNLSNQFRTILENKIVATNVKATLIVNEKYLYIRDNELEMAEGKAIDQFGSKQACLNEIEKLKKSQLTRDIGIATLDTEITFEYGIRRVQNNTASNHLINEMLFQLQIEYTHNGARFLRVYTKTQKFTKNKDLALNNLLSRNILYSNAMQNMSEQTMSKNVKYANYRSHAVTSLSSSKGYQPPKELKDHQLFHERFMSRTKNSNHIDFDDDEACTILRAKKINRKNFTE